MRVRHSALVRVTHWITVASFLALLYSGIAILLAHPRLYWGETGALGTPSLIDLPLPMVLTGQTGWGRYLHFLSAWVCVVTGAVYVLGGMSACHFRNDLFPVTPKRQSREGGRRPEPANYDVLQRVSYTAVVFLLFPLMIWTGFAMSPAITSVFPVLVTALGGQQSARTIHFVVSNLLVLFLVGHVVMVYLSGFTRHVGAMILGGNSAVRETRT